MRNPVKIIRRQHGAVAIVVALSIFVLIGMIGLAIDLGRMFVIKTELQNAADACALAAAKELGDASDSLTRADAAGILVGGRNNINFQGETATAQTTLTITYSDELNGTYNTSGSIASSDIPEMDYVRCAITRPNIGVLFMGVLGFGNQGISAQAVASMLPSQSPCIIPIGLCSNNATPPASCPDGTSPDSNGLCIGQWRSGKFDASVNGEFNWLDFPDDGIEGNIKDQLVEGYCGAITGQTVEGQTGELGESAASAWNSRFGLYKNGEGNYQYDGNPAAIPDQTGYSYTPSTGSQPDDTVPGPEGPTFLGRPYNAYPNFIAHRVQNGTYPKSYYQGNDLTGLTINPSYKSNDAALNEGRTDRRVVVVPVVDCTGWGPSHTTTLEAKFACVLLLHPIDPNSTDDVYMEYRGIAGVPGSPCPAFGLPGGAGAEVPGLVQ